MNYQRTGYTLSDDIAVLLEELETQTLENDWRMLPVESVHGFLTALAIGPRLIVPSIWLPHLFFEREELPEFKNGKQAEQVIHAILNIFNCMLQMLKNGELTPYISIINEDGVERADYSLWCSGFVLGTLVFESDEWDLLNDHDLAEICLPIFHQAGIEHLDRIYNPEELGRMDISDDEIGDAISEAIYDINGYFNGYPSDELNMPYTREEPKTGRNDPCPCGSGKKFKKCCG